MTIKNDRWIREMAKKGMITPFEEEQVRKDVISYGVSSYGYDLRVSDTYKIFTNVNSTIIDPKNFNDKSFVEYKGDFCIVPPNSFALAHSVEYFKIPRNVLTICLGKSSYARCFRGDTKVALANGTSISLEEMATRSEKGEFFWGYSINHYGKIQVSMLENPRFIGRDSLLEITLDNDEKIYCTPDHKFLLRDGVMVEANKLRAGSSLMPLYRDLYRGYESVYQPLTGNMETTHRLSDDWNLRFGVYEEQANTHRHHIDFDRPELKTEQSLRSKDYWQNVTSERLEQQKEIARSLNIRKEIDAKKVRIALDQTGSIRGASRALNCDRSVFRRFPEVINAFRGCKETKNHKVVSVKEIAGTHDVYCLSVPEFGNFALEAGVFVHNCGIIVNITPFEPEWEGVVTLEISNTTPLPAKIYSNEGLAQVLFFEADEECEISYADKKGKYQTQSGITLPRL